jgi:hypothetical protein
MVPLYGYIEMHAQQNIERNYMLSRKGCWLVTNYTYGSGANCRSLSKFIHTVVSINSNRVCDRQLQLQVCITVELHPSGLIGTASRKSGYLDISLKIHYIGSLQFGCYYLEYVPASKPFDHA